MTILGLPLSMFLVFVATVLAGSLGAIHYVIVHVIMGRGFPDEDLPIEVHDPGDRMTVPSEARELGDTERQDG
jgi:hypothetical protein